MEALNGITAMAIKEYVSRLAARGYGVEIIETVEEKSITYYAGGVKFVYLRERYAIPLLERASIGAEVYGVTKEEYLLHYTCLV